MNKLCSFIIAIVLIAFLIKITMIVQTLQINPPLNKDQAQSSNSTNITQAQITEESWQKTTIKAMTWRILNSKESLDQAHHYALVGSDQITNPYQGDTLISEKLPILCLKKADLAKPDFIESIKTPGGSSRRTWSYSYIGFTNPIQGYMLTSKNVANQKCTQKFGDGYRMAEFHDGDPSFWSGWDFWGELVTEIQPNRFWVSIYDQTSNPWDKLNQKKP